MTAATSSDTLLSYAITTKPDPLQASPAVGNPLRGSITIVVSNNTQDTIYCDEIDFSFSPGDGPTDLTSDTKGILAAASPAGQWDISQTADGTFTATPVIPRYQAILSTGLVFEIYNTAINQQPGTATLTVQEVSGPDPDPTTMTTGTYYLTKFPYATNFRNLAASLPLVGYNQTVTLTWEGSGGPSYTMTVGSAGIATRSYDVTNVRSWTSPPLTTAATFELVAEWQEEGQTATATLSTTVLVADPSITATNLSVTGTTSIFGDPQPLDYYGVYQALTDGLMIATGGYSPVPPMPLAAALFIRLQAGTLKPPLGFMPVISVTAQAGTIGLFDFEWNHVETCLFGTATLPVRNKLFFSYSGTWDPTQRGKLPQTWAWWIPLSVGPAANTFKYLPDVEVPEFLPPVQPSRPPDREPARRELVSVLERIVGTPISDKDKQQLLDVLRTL